MPDVSKELIQTLRWLASGASQAKMSSAMLGELCVRLSDMGVPLSRVNLFVETLHPDVFGRAFLWRRGADVVMTAATTDLTNTSTYLMSPLAVMYDTGAEVRLRLDDPAHDRYPIVAELKTEGATDYIVIPVAFVNGEIHASSWCTDHRDGFTEGHLETLRTVMPLVSRVIEIITLRRTATTLLDTYVGNRAGERILAGQIRRGHTETMNAAIWLSDLRGFTALSDRLPPEEVVHILNDYFDCQVPAILRRGGEVLKFMGDGLLAVFPVSDSEAREETADRVLLAAREARAAVAALTNTDGQHYRFGVALHVGQVLYGNIGGGNRLDFTCIGPAVNLAARLEKIASRLGRTVVASEDFAGACTDEWRDLGEFPIAGFAAPSRVFGLPDEDQPC